MRRGLHPALLLVFGLLTAACRPPLVLTPCSDDSTCPAGYFCDTDLGFCAAEPGAGQDGGSAADAATTDAPMADAPITDVPMTDTPMTDAPMTDAPMTDAPMTDASPAVDGGPTLYPGDLGSTACEPDWCWVLPGPAGAGIHDLHVHADGELWAAAGTAYALRRMDNRWVPYPMPAGTRLSTFWEHGGDLYAMGFEGNWARWNGSIWEEQGPSAPGEAIRAACATDDGRVWAAGSVGTYDFVQDFWTLDSSHVAQDLLCVGNQVWRLTTTGVDKFIGSNWTPIFAILGGRRLDGSGGDDLWVAADSVVSWNGLDTYAQPTGSPAHDLDIDGMIRWVVGPGGFASRWIVASWQTEPTTTSRDLNAVAVVALDNVWMGGRAGVLLNWNGSSVLQVEDRSENTYLDGWAHSMDDIWLVGHDGQGFGLTMHWNGETWTRVDNPSRSPLGTIWGFGPDDVWAGSGPVLLHWTQGAWQEVDIGEPPDVADLWGPDAGDLWILREGGSVLRWNGAFIHQRYVLPSVGGSHVAMWGSSNSDVWVSRQEPVDTCLHQFNGVGWYEDCLGLSAGTMVDLWGYADNDVWGVTAWGTIMHWDGAEWSPHPAQLNSGGSAIGGTGPNLQFALGMDSQIQRYESGAWTEVALPAKTAWHEVVSTSQGALVVGDGAVLWIQ